jgi:glutamate-ammonia-ligase adenylyltransferase
VPALHALREARHLSAQDVVALIDAYRFLRRLENRLQMRRDAQTHALPQEAHERRRIAVALDYPDWEALQAELDRHRRHVTDEFAALLAPRSTGTTTSELSAYWRALPEAGDASALAQAGFAQPNEADGTLRDFVRSPGVRDLSDAARARLDRVMPVLLDATVASVQQLLALRRLLALLQNILRRASYLALLDEQPAALTRLVDVVTRSALLAERLAAHPLLLDELLDARAAGTLPRRDELQATCAGALVHDDIETALLALNETRQSLSFRIALATLDGRQPARDSARQLAWLADAVIEVVVALALREMQAAHGGIAASRFAVIGYGSLGGEELGFGSDLDLVFLYDAPAGAASDGARALDAPRWFARLAQKIVSLLATPSAGGRLYEADVRLRPDGAKGLLVSTLASFADYQRERAWTWEHQALVRARCVAGDAGLCEAFERVRGQTLARERDAGKLRDDIVAMRAKMRAELDRSDGARFDLKQGGGGLVDLEFLLQYLVLRDAVHCPGLLAGRDTPALIAAAREARMLAADASSALLDAHATLLSAGLDCTLDRRQRLVIETDTVSGARTTIRSAAQEVGLVF